MLSIKSKDGLFFCLFVFAFTLNGAGLEICAKRTKTSPGDRFPPLPTSPRPRSEGNRAKNRHRLASRRPGDLPGSRGGKPLSRNPVKHSDTARTLWVLEFEKIGVKSCVWFWFFVFFFGCKAFGCSRKTQSHDSRSSL